MEGDARVADFTMRPVARDRLLATRVSRFFARIESSMDDIAVEERLIACLQHVFDRHEVRGPRSVGSSPPVARAIRRLDEAPEAAISLAELARSCDASRFQLLRGFAREVGTTPHAYQVQRRLRLVRRMLAAGRSPADAATLAGFSDQSHMTRAFARHFGITPGRYRASVARG
jgi:AraC-like DNA-binding protein